MALTPEEAEELRLLEAEMAAEERAASGRKAITAAHTVTRPPRARPFSVYRATVGGLRDALQGAMDTVADLDDAVADLPVVGGFLSGKKSRDALARAAGSSRSLSDPVTGADGKVINGIDERGVVQLPALRGEENAGTPERLVRGITSFLVPYAGTSKAVGVARAATRLGQAGRAMVAGAAVDFSQLDPVEGNIANVLRDTFGLKSDVIDALASEDDDGALEQRFKATATGAAAGLLTDATLEGGLRLVKAYRAWRGSSAEAQATMAVLKADLRVNRAARAADRRTGLPPIEGGMAADAAIPVSKEPGAAADTQGAIEAAPPAPRTVSAQGMEDIVAYLTRAADTEAEPGALSQLADDVLWGDPENAVAKLGIDPAKLDFSVYDDPALFGRLQERLADAYETIAEKLGRSNVTVAHESTLKAARALATRPSVLQALHGATRNLDAYLTGARLFVGSHAHKMLALADEAKAEIGGAGAGEKWSQFLESFHRQAYYLGAVRGASSEVGRALSSLQIIGKVRKARRRVAERVPDATAPGADEAASAGLRSAQEEYAAAFRDFTTDADKLDFIDKLQRTGGDLNALSQLVRRENMTTLKRVDGALRETIGNLFSVGTATLNVASGMTSLGLRGLAKALAGVSRAALIPFDRQNAELARYHLLGSHGYFYGVVSGFRDAYAQAIAVLEKEGYAELALNADGLGLSKITATFEGKSGEAATALSRGEFERIETRNNRAFAITAADTAALVELSNKLAGPAFFQAGLRALVRTVGAAVNISGSLSRIGTTAFINMPDQFVGVLAARAGAHAQAVKIAAAEAAELELEGQALGQYLKARSVELADGVDGWADEPFEAGAREVLNMAGESEAREVLFQDELELGFDRRVAATLGSTPFAHLFVPFVKTPLRILERTAIDYTPLGLLKDRIRRAILAGGTEGDEALARLALGMLATYAAMTLADDRTIIGTDGGYRSSARLARESYTLRIGDDEVEYSRLDPLGTLLGLGADLRAYFDAVEHKIDDEDENGLLQAFEAVVWSASANMLSKTWLTSVRQLSELAGMGDDARFSQRLKTYIGSFGSRLVPGSGIQRQVEKFDDGAVREAATVVDSITRSTLGADSLPVKRDPILGRPVRVDEMDRLIGLRAGPRVSDEEDPVVAELERLSFNVGGVPRNIKGVRLTATQYSRLLELRGQVVRNEDTGLTLEETLTVLIGLPEYHSLSREGRITAMRDEMRGFTRLAKEQLVREDRALASRVLRAEVFDELRRAGVPPEQQRSEYQKLARELGLQPSP